MKKSANDFSKGPVWRSIVSQAVPLTIAQLVSLLYNVVDRIYLGHMGDGTGIELTGVGLAFPVITLMMAFAALFGAGGVPLFSMARGAGQEERAGKILGNSFTLLLLSSIVLMLIGLLFYRPILFAFGASNDSIVYAGDYLRIYLFGTCFSMLTTGLNGYINAQGFPRIGMLSVVIGAVLNIILDPIFIFVFHMGVMGAALATVVSQVVSAFWVLSFLFGKKALVPLKITNICIRGDLTKEITKLGISNFMFSGTTFLVQVACNKTLQIYGEALGVGCGDLYVGVMTVVNSVREIFMLPLNGMMNGAQPVISYNFGAKQYSRVKAGIRFNSVVGFLYSLITWILIFFLPKLWVSIFSNETQLIEVGANALRIYFFGFAFMAFQFVGQSTFQAVGDAKHAVFFSLLRKVIIVLPLTVFLPWIGFGVRGVFMAEPFSNVIGGLASYLTMRRKVYKKLLDN